MNDLAPYVSFCFCFVCCEFGSAAALLYLLNRALVAQLAEHRAVMREV